MYIWTNNKTRKEKTKKNIDANVVSANTTHYLRSSAEFEIRFVNTQISNILSHL